MRIRLKNPADTLKRGHRTLGFFEIPRVWCPAFRLRRWGGGFFQQNQMRTRWLWLWLTFAVAGTGVRAAEVALKSGDRVVFLGDSITALGDYTRLVVSYITLREPGASITFLRNAGVPGDTAPGGVKRLATDVLSQNPTVVSICFGMNDGRVPPFTPPMYDTFMAGMSNLVATLTAAHVRVVLLTPGCVDPDTAGRWFKAPGEPAQCNAMLGRLAEGVKALAARENLPVADIHSAMLAAQLKGKAVAARWTMIPDGIHPDTVGATVMAYTLVAALGYTGPVSSLTLDARHGLVATERCTVTGLQIESNKISFIRRDAALPSFVGTNATVIATCFPLVQSLREYRFAVTGLAAGTWQLTVGTAGLVGDYTATQLAAGVDLSDTPGPWRALGERVEMLCGDQQKLRVNRASFGARLQSWLPADATAETAGLFEKVDRVIGERETARQQAAVGGLENVWTLTRIKPES